MAIVKPAEMPEFLKPYMAVRGKARRLKGVFLKGCVVRGEGSSFRRVAHAHCFAGDPYRGWICIRKPERLQERPLLIHELTHLLTRNGHTQKFFDKYVELGGKLEEDQAWKNRETFRERQESRKSNS